MSTASAGPLPAAFSATSTKGTPEPGAVVQVHVLVELHSFPPEASDPSATTFRFNPATATMSPVWSAGVKSDWSQDSPPLLVRKMAPSSPTMTPTPRLANATLRRSLLVGTRWSVCHFGRMGVPPPDEPPPPPPPRQLGARR